MIYYAIFQSTVRISTVNTEAKAPKYILYLFAKVERDKV